MALSSTTARVLEHVRLFPGMTELQVAKAIFGPDAVQPRVNTIVRQLLQEGLLRREGSVRPLRLYVTGAPVPMPPMGPVDTVPLTEDQIKDILRAWLQEQGWNCVVKMGHERGIDIEARRGSERWVIEVKGPGSLQPMRVNYFLAILGETLQRMSDSNARYSIALPDLPQFRGLWARLPNLAKQRTQIDAIFVSSDGRIDFVR